MNQTATYISDDLQEHKTTILLTNTIVSNGGHAKGAVNENQLGSRTLSFSSKALTYLLDMKNALSIHFTAGLEAAEGDGLTK